MFLKLLIGKRIIIIVSALGRIKCAKASCSSGVVAEMLQAFGEGGIGRMTDLFNGILDEYKIPEDWNTSVIFNCFKNKGEAIERGNYKGLKLSEHLMKIINKVSYLMD